MEPSDRDLARELERVDPDPDDPDPADMWEAWLLGKRPDEMSTQAEADAVRNLWLFHFDDLEPGDLDKLSDDEIDELDEFIRLAEGP